VSLEAVKRERSDVDEMEVEEVEAEELEVVELLVLVISDKDVRVKPFHCQEL